MSLKIRAENRNLKIIRIFIDSIDSCGTGRVINIDSEEKRQRTKGEPTLRRLEEKMPASERQELLYISSFLRVPASMLGSW